MSNAGPLWERLVRAVLRRERTGIDVYGQPTGNVPSSFSDIRDIDPILRAADEIQDEDPNISRILCEHAYSLAQTLDPSSEGRGVLQFRTGLMSVIKQNLARQAGRIGRRIDRSKDRTCLRDFYNLYREKHNVDKLWEEEMEQRESGALHGNIQELEQETLKRKRVFATLKVLGTVLEQLSEEVSPEEAKRLMPEELKRVIESDADMTEDLIDDNIIPLDAPGVTDFITSFPETSILLKHLHHLRIPLKAIKSCTQDFNEANFIGKGGYGRVYKGTLSWAYHKNQYVAIKRLDVTGFQGNKEFYTEIAMLTQYRHDNIIALLGFCDDNKEMILVYEYASRGSLDTYLTNEAMMGELSWFNRLEICIGVASALDYLHNHVAAEYRVIHRDIKSANILLDENWIAKLSDFGLSKIGLTNQQNTFLITNVAGTHGYCDPQYEKTGILTKESDVYSFGVVLFEVLCGRLACVVKYHDERRFLHHMVRSCYRFGELDKMVDHKIIEHIKPRTLNKFSAVAYQCLQKTREQRPTIAEVALHLKRAREIQFEPTIIGTCEHPLRLHPPPGSAS